MTIKRYNSEKDNTIINALRENLSTRSTGGNLGASDILEVFSIFGQASTSSLEQSRMLIQFPVDEISSDRASGILPESGSVKFRMKMFNTPHGQTTPTNYQLTVHPLVRAWSEGDGIDMESYLDQEASNWISASSEVPWHNTGSDFANPDLIIGETIPLKYSQTFQSGVEDLDIDITEITEEWLKHQSGASTAATASIELLQNPGEDESITIYSHEGEKHVYTFITSSRSTSGNNSYIEIAGSATGTATLLKTKIVDTLGSTVVSERDGALIQLTQSVAGLHGNMPITTDIPNDSASISQFSGGTGFPNYGVVVKLEDSFEDGSKERSFYTKKFYARTSHEFFLKPQIEVQWDGSVKDDRNYVLKSSSLAPSGENLNNIYYYNRFRGSMVDIPSTGSRMVVQFYSELGSSPVSVVNTAGQETLHITASKESAGIYKAVFAYSGSEASLYDVWKKDVFTPAVAGVQAVAQVTVGPGFPAGGETFSVEDTSGTSATFIFVAGENWSDGSKEDGTNNIRIGLAALADEEALIDRVVSVFTAQTDIEVTADKVDAQTLRLTQDVTGSDGNNDVDLTGVNGFVHAGGNQGFVDGVTAVDAFHTYTDFVTGSGFSVHVDEVDVAYPIPSYVVNITNLKPSYLQGEKATFRVYTRNKNWQPNIYTVASKTAPVNTIREMFYKITKVSDNYDVISYSTGSTPSFSSLSYDKDGSYFDLDMALLEKNNAYEISFVFKDGPNYLELQEKFRFRVDV